LAVDVAAHTVHVQIGQRYTGRVRAGGLRAAALAALRHQGVGGPAELTIVVAGDALLRKLNRDFLGLDAPTDVLSFPSGVRSEELGVRKEEPAFGTSRSNARPSQLATRNSQLLTPNSQLATRNSQFLIPNSYLGDIILSFPRARAQAAAAGHAVEAELNLLVVHGVLHLLGHDHAGRADKARMWEAQEDVLLGLEKGRKQRK
jgi:probable rRNA maturation factor